MSISYRTEIRDPQSLLGDMFAVKGSEEHPSVVSGPQLLGFAEPSGGRGCEAVPVLNILWGNKAVLLLMPTKAGFGEVPKLCMHSTGPSSWVSTSVKASSFPNWKRMYFRRPIC